MTKAILFCSVLTIIISFSCVKQYCVPKINAEEWKLILNNSKGIKSGERSRENLMKGIKQYLAKARFAYNRALRDGFKCNAKIILEIIVLGSGKIENVKIIAKDYDFPSFDVDLIETIKKWDFGTIPNLNDTTIIQYPFVFTHYKCN
jgi:phosphotransferase system HPr-like phosphotransfer protein